MKTSGREAATFTAGAAVAASLVDAVLLQLRRDYFTGGFLSVDSASTWPQRFAFGLGSLAMDAIVSGVLVIAVMAVASRLRLGRAARRGLALLIGSAPLVLASLIEYEIVAHLGDAFDLGLMFDLVGRRPAELLAVAWAHLVLPVLGVILLSTAAVLVLRWVTRRWPGDVRAARTGPWMARWAAAAVAVIVATTVVRTQSDVLDNGWRRKPSGQVLGALVTRVTDVDRDGYGVLSRPSDPSPFDARVYPYAIDVPGNGIDEDGVGGDLPVASAVLDPVGEAPRFAQTPPVLVVMLETFRADLLGAREAGLDVTPNLNRLAAEGVSSQHAYSHNGYTVQSRAHLFRGRLVGASRPGTLIDDFNANGYDTAYFSAQDESFGGERYDVGSHRAGHFYDARQDRARRSTTFTTAGSLGVSSDVLLERVGAYLSERSSTRPLFLYANIYDTHFPYGHDGLKSLIPHQQLATSDITPARTAELRAMYRNAAANVDAAIGELRRRVAAHVGRAPVTIVLADHGESLFDEGFLGHGYALNDVQTRIPLVVTGLGLDLCEPIGQADLRDSLMAALVRAADDARPTVRSCDAHRVFQYLGTIDRPRQIAFIERTQRLVYDLRQRRARIGDEPWVDLSAVDRETRESLLQLIHFWERLRWQDKQSSGEPTP